MWHKISFWVPTDLTFDNTDHLGKAYHEMTLSSYSCASSPFRTNQSTYYMINVNENDFLLSLFSYIYETKKYKYWMKTPTNMSPCQELIFFVLEFIPNHVSKHWRHGLHSTETGTLSVSSVFSGNLWAVFVEEPCGGKPVSTNWASCTAKKELKVWLRRKFFFGFCASKITVFPKEPNFCQSTGQAT